MSGRNPPCEDLGIPGRGYYKGKDPELGTSLGNNPQCG